MECLVCTSDGRDRDTAAETGEDACGSTGVLDVIGTNTFVEHILTASG